VRRATTAPSPYTLVVNELYISTWSWDNVTVVSVTDGELVIEIDDLPPSRSAITSPAMPARRPSRYRRISTRWCSPPTSRWGETIRLWIDAAEADRPDVWVDLNNNGTKDDGEAVTEFDKFVKYTLRCKNRDRLRQGNVAGLLQQPARHA